MAKREERKIQIVFRLRKCKMKEFFILILRENLILREFNKRWRKMSEGQNGQKENGS